MSGGENFRRRSQKVRARGLSICGLVLAWLGTLLLVLGFFSPHWLESHEEAKTSFDRIGLWSACYNDFSYALDQLGLTYDGCFWVYAYEYKPIFEWMNPQWFLAVQLMMTMSFILNMVTSILLTLGYFGRVVPNTNCLAQLSMSICMFISALMMGISMGLFGVHSRIDRQWFPRPDQNFLGWGYFVALVSTFFNLFSAMCLLCDSFRIRFDNEKKNRGRPDPYVNYQMKPVKTYPQY